MVNRIVSVGDDFTLPPAVKIGDANLTPEAVAANLPARLEVAALEGAYASELATTATGDDRAMLQSKIDGAAISGKPVALRRNAVYQVSAPLTIPSGVTIEGNGATIKALAGNNAYVITNADRTNGNAGIILRDLKVDGNAAGQTAQFNAIEMVRVTKSKFENLDVTGAQRNQMFPNGTNGDGLCLIYSHDNEISGGRFHGNTYDGIKLRSSNRNKIINPTCVDNGRSGIQIAFYSPTGPPYNVGESIEAEGSNDNIITGAVITHSTGTPHSAAPTTSGIYLHTAARNAITGFRIEGVQQGIGFYSGNRDNLFSNGIIRTRYGATARASIDLEHGTEYRNTFSNIHVRPLAGVAGKMLNIAAGAVSNRVFGCRFDLGDGTGAWTLTNAGADTQILDYTTDFPINDVGSNTMLREAKVASSSTTRARLDSFNAATAAVPTGWVTRWNQTGATWTEDAAGYLKAVKTSAGRAALANWATGDHDDVEILAKVRTDTAATGQTPVGIIVRGSGAAAAETGYFIALSEPGTLIYVMRYAAGTGTLLNSFSGVVWTVNTWQWVRARITGSGATVTIRAKTWADGAQEPAAWQVSSSDTAAQRVATPGFVGVLASSISTNDIDSFEVIKV